MSKHSTIQRALSAALLGSVGAGAALFGGLPQETAETPAQSEEAQDAEAALGAAFAAAGVYLDRASTSVAFHARTEVRAEYLEYLLVNSHGAVHESLFVTGADAQVLGTAFVAAGAKEGTNVVYTAKDPAPTREEIRAGVPTHEIAPPTGDPVYMYVAWTEKSGVPNAAGEFPGDTLHFHRIEDLVVDLQRDRTLRRHGWVWLGSRMVPAANEGDEDQFAADLTGNLICVSFFSQGDTLLTPALPECASQTSWIPNRWLLPAPGAEVLVIGSMTPIETVPAAFKDSVPFVSVGDADPAPDGPR